MNTTNPLWYLLEKYPEKDWDWYKISGNPNITMEYIETHPEKPWLWWRISRNPNITMEFIEKYPEKLWDWDCMSYNKFTYQNRLNRQKPAFLLLENINTSTNTCLPKLVNLHIVKRYL